MALESTFASVDQFVPAELVGAAVGGAVGGGALYAGVEALSGFHPAAVLGGGAVAGVAATFAIRKLATDEEKYKQEMREKLLKRVEAYKASAAAPAAPAPAAAPAVEAAPAA